MICQVACPTVLIVLYATFFAFPRILLIDDHAMFRSGLRMVLSSEIPNVEVFEANSVGEAINRSPDNMNVVLLDIQLKGSSGLGII